LIMSELNEKKEQLRGLEDDLQAVLNDSVHLEQLSGEINSLVKVFGVFQILLGLSLIFGVYVWFAAINQIFSAVILVIAFWFLYRGISKFYLMYRAKKLLKRIERAVKRAEIIRIELEKEVSEIN
jgi:hypothetical protein